ncbi:MAG: phytanoyl-CoA dioxygenase family protein [Armatimonadetes bacterium]|nr:phytanoyl-CoA dioxygenase family protein [Armatimonadota bacterium]MDE2205378.1 phytanoyl-CoA dioxygenase family protein [Armatimonadota bacterium]
MQLSYAQKRQFVDLGYVVVPGVVPTALVNAALRAINACLDQGLPAERMQEMRAQSYCKEIQTQPVISDLFNRSPAHALLESMVGEGTIPEATGAQIALRFPSLADPPRPPSPHIDGIHTPTNGVPKGVIQNFTGLVGIYLSGVNEEYAGNFAVWPGSHARLQQFFRDTSPEAILDGMPKIDLGEPTQIMAQAGDVAICHYLLAHSACANVSPFIRYATYFRMHKQGHAERLRSTMVNMWEEWDGLQDMLLEEGR